MSANASASASEQQQHPPRRRQRFSGGGPNADGEMVSTRRSECVQVALVVRPLLPHEPRGSECLHQPQPEKPEVVLDCAPFPFAFDHVGGPEGGISSVYDACVAPTLLPNVLRGCNATVLAYGQTGSGKTHTMGSGAGARRVPGLIQMSVEQIFERLPPGAAARASFVQIYEDAVHDLLAPAAADGELPRLHLKREGAGWGLPAARRELVESAADVTALLARGAAARATSSTRLNEHSSRSHAVLSVELRLADPKSEGASGQLRPKLTFVDLAGSERTKRAGTEGKVQQEGIQINLSLFHLNHVIHALGSRAAHVPYNGSSLTKVLADRLGGATQTLMLACASPAEPNALETLSTLYTVSRARTIVSKPRVARQPGSERLSAEEAARQADEERAREEERHAREREQLVTHNRELAAALDASERLRSDAVRRALCARTAAAACSAVVTRAAAEQRTAAEAVLAERADKAQARAWAAEADAAASAIEVRRLEAALSEALQRAEAAEGRAAAAEERAAAAAERAAAEAEAGGAGRADEAAPGKVCAEPATAEEESAQRLKRRRGAKGAGRAQAHDERDYDPVDQSGGARTHDFGASRVDRFEGHGSFYPKPISLDPRLHAPIVPQPSRESSRVLTPVDTNRAAATPSKRSTRASARSRAAA